MTTLASKKDLEYMFKKNKNSKLVLQSYLDGVLSNKIQLSNVNLKIEKYKEKKLKQLKQFINDIKEFTGIGHRVVQAGTVYSDSTVIDQKCIKTIEKYTKLAPLHNPSELKVINIFKKKLPKVTNVAAFDTSFHTTIPEINHIYPINKKISDKYEIRRYGYHGVSYKFITQKMQKILNKKTVNLIVCHIGNGASICAIKNSKSFNTSMGLTPLEGLMMGTRCGSVDPSIATYLLRCGMKGEQVDNLFNKQSGLMGFVGSGDLRDAFKMKLEGNKTAKFAIDLYINRIITKLQQKITIIIMNKIIIITTIFIIFIAEFTKYINVYILSFIDRT